MHSQHTQSLGFNIPEVTASGKKADKVAVLVSAATG